jgi:hypothetical protein
MTIKINHNQLKEHIKKSYKTGVALFVQGTTGIGKSDTIKNTAKEIAKTLGLEFVEGWEKDKFGYIDIRLNQYSPEDLKGLPDLDRENKTTTWLSPAELPKGGKGIILFDELNLAAPSIQASAYQLILDKRLGSYKLPEGWCIIAAGNGIADRANVYDLPAPLKNRFTHTQLQIPTTEAWTEWAIGYNINNKIISFLNYKPSYLFTFDANNEDSAFATPRSWAFGSALIEGEEDTENIERYLSTAVGEGIAREYSAYHKMAEKLDMDKIIKNAKEFVSPKEINLKYAIAGALADYYNKKPASLQNIAIIWQKLEPEFTIISIKMARAYKPIQFVKEIFKLKEWDNISKDYQKYLM